VSINTRNILLANDDITVFGPQVTLDVLVDIGPAGVRGSQFFVGIGNPNIVEIGQTPILNDVYINTSPDGELGYVYQYQSQPGGDTWVKILDIYPSFYSINYDVIFDSGSGTATIPVSDILTVTGTAPTAENFSVQYSIVHNKPVASSMEIPPFVGEEENLVINFEAVEYNTGTWSGLDQEVTINILITIVETPTVS
jgi:hypothetical protein